MKFYPAFWKLFWARPDRALGALYWRLTGRKVRARNRLRLGLEQSPDAYRHWIELIERNEAAAQEAGATIAGWPDRPLFSILVDRRPDPDQATIEAMLRAMEAQVYPEWELIVLRSPGVDRLPSPSARLRIVDVTEAGEALRSASAAARGDYLLPLPFGVILPSTALFRYAQALQSGDKPDLLFGDQDEIDDLGQRRQPWFKPQWNDELALAQDYASQALVVSAAAARSALERGRFEGRAEVYALALAVARRPGAVVRHVPYIQSHVTPNAVIATAEEKGAVVRARLTDEGVTVRPDAHGTVRIDWPLPDPRPIVSIIIPTRDRIDLLRACLSSLEAQTTYRPFEIIVVDNGSIRADSLAYLGEIAGRNGMTVIRDERPYNFSQLNNLAAVRAQGDYLCLLNNDTEVIEGDWLTAMMRYAIRPHVGAVGARLLYDDGSIQHAGVTVGMGDAAGHAHRFQKRDAPGYFARTHVAHYVTAVTAACLVVEKRKFLAVGGLDEERLAVAFNDVDLCLKLRKAGWHNVYTPHATLLHHESKSRGKDFAPQHIERYRGELGTLQERWGTRDFADPLHHPHLDRSSEQYLIGL